jgi:two-component system cell cycle sensor histidine kinase/response regulator CckA
MCSRLNSLPVQIVHADPSPIEGESANLSAVQRQPGSIIQEQTSAVERIRVLLAEDNPGDVELTRHNLSMAKQVCFTLEVADSFLDTLQSLETGTFDLILLDLSVLEGRDLKESLVTFRRTANIAVVVLTGLDDERFGTEAVKAGADDYLVKGRIDGDLLVRSIRFATERNRREHLQERLDLAQRLEGIGRLAGGVAHDFNNILTAIMGFTEMAQDSLPNGEDLPGHLDGIAHAAERAADLTQQLLAFARQQITQPKVMNINACLQDVERMLRRLITANIDLKTRLAGNLWRVKVDPGQIEQVIVNLAVNARDAMPAGGRIDIETANVCLEEMEARLHKAEAGEYVLLSVRDTGEGMSDEVKAHIFEPFFTTKQKGKGTGLGLATCYGIVQQNGGVITVDSVPGTGTTFRIYFPRQQAAATPTASIPEAVNIPSGKETILLAEDEPMVRRIAAMALRKFGYQVLEAANGVEAIRLAEAHDGPIHLLITDMVMPLMGGREVAERLLAVRPQTRVLFLSGYIDDTMERERFLEGGMAFLQKPFTQKILAHKLQEILPQNAT